MSVEREMSLAEWCAKLPNQHKVNQELAELTKQLAALSLPNLASPVLNKIKAEAYREAADIVENIDVYTFVHGGSSYDDGGLTLSSAATAIRAKADELEQSK